MKRKLAALVLAIPLGLVALAGCSTGGGGGAAGGEWSANAQQNYMKSCTSSAAGANGAEKYCQCTLDALQKQYSESELIELEKTITSNGSGDEAKKFQDVVKSCVGELSK